MLTQPWTEAEGQRAGGTEEPGTRKGGRHRERMHAILLGMGNTDQKCDRAACTEAIALLYVV